MYRFSRSIYREIASDVVEDERDPTGCRNKQAVLDACESVIRRLTYDRRYFARPAKALFTEVRMHFAIGDQLRVWMVIDRNIKLAQRVPGADARGGARRDRPQLPCAHPQGHALPARAAAQPRLLPVAQAPRGELRRAGDPGRGARRACARSRPPLRHCHVGGDRKVGRQWGRGPGSWGAGASRMCRFAACSWESTWAGRSPTPSSSTARRCTRRRRRRPRTISRAGCWRRSRRRSSAPAPARRRSRASPTG